MKRRITSYRQNKTHQTTGKAAYVVNSGGITGQRRLPALQRQKQAQHARQARRNMAARHAVKIMACGMAAAWHGSAACISDIVIAAASSLSGAIANSASTLNTARHRAT